MNRIAPSRIRFEMSARRLVFELIIVIALSWLYYDTRSQSQFVLIILGVAMLSFYLASSLDIWFENDIYVSPELLMLIGYLYTGFPLLQLGSNPTLVSILFALVTSTVLTIAVITLTIGMFVIGGDLGRPLNAPVFTENNSRTVEGFTVQQKIENSAIQPEVFNRIITPATDNFFVFGSEPPLGGSQVLFKTVDSKTDFVNLVTQPTKDTKEHMGECGLCGDQTTVLADYWYVQTNLWWRFHTLDCVSLCTECTQRIAGEAVTKPDSAITETDVFVQEI